MKRTNFLLPAIVVFGLSACGDDTAAGDTDGSESSTGTPDPDTTSTSNIPIDPDSGGSEEESGGTTEGGGPTCSADDECGSEGNECPSGFNCIACICVEDNDPNNICPDGWANEGSYGDCGNGEECGGGDLDVACAGGPSDSSVCLYLGCETTCDCPAPPEGFEALATCTDQFGPGGMTDGINDCFLDCSEGQACPDGMFCGGGVCYAGEPAPFPDYEDCLNEDIPECDADGLCLSDGETFGACASVGCNDASDCGEAPDTGDAMPGCTEFPDGSATFCSLTCDDGETCPDGMICLALSLGTDSIGSHCLWPPAPESGFGDCASQPDDVCLDAETCIDNVGKTSGDTQVCSAGDCVDPVADCPPAPETGDAPVACQNIDGADGDECVLDCSGGETCPDGAVCTDDGFCAYAVPEVPGFADCGNNPDLVCLEGEACVTDAGADPNTAVCALSSCVDADVDCPAAPEGGDASAVCANIDGVDGDECALDCSGGAMCPTGMVCTTDDYCAWEDAGFALTEDFTNGFGPGWLVIDVDGQTPNAAVGYVTDAWVAVVQVLADNPAAHSTSWYAPAGASDDWMITPAVPLSATSVVSWEAVAPDGDFPDGYEVYVVDANDDDLLDFIGTGDPMLFLMNNDPQFSVAGEAQVLTPHSLSAAAGEPLADLVGSNVRVLWRNNSNDQFILVVDNVTITD